ncbi:hypothetical protein F511_10948 [Dorcoceras hygrometricum]|uniref:Uncharacterized protein n=1 Tax=Dorcoceras hygrometricum TaxID=472368 RepID=A0A2Z7AAB1_9LAMI|nr:hypothetical protein F511_10948 [Dorcoceras hygrometricum]
MVQEYKNLSQSFEEVKAKKESCANKAELVSSSDMQAALSVPDVSTGPRNADTDHAQAGPNHVPAGGAQTQVDDTNITSGNSTSGITVDPGGMQGEPDANIDSQNEASTLFHPNLSLVTLLHPSEHEARLSRPETETHDIGNIKQL